MPIKNKNSDKPTLFQTIYETLKSFETLRSLRRKYNRITRFWNNEIHYRFDRLTLHLKKIGIPTITANKVIHALIVSDGVIYTSESQFDPLFTYRKTLKQQFGFIFRVMRMESALRHPQIFSQFDVLFVKISYYLSTVEAKQIIESIYAAKGSAKLIFFDGDIALCIRWPEILPYLDLYVKNRFFADLNQYDKIFIGRCNLTDYVASRWGVSFVELGPKSAPLEPEKRYKLFLGDSLVINNMMRNLYQFKLQLKKQQISTVKVNDIVCRMTLEPKDWRYYLRQDVIPKLQSLSSQYQVIATTEQISQRKCHLEMFASKVCVSPFGYSEICFRDFEAVLCRCLLIKPDMSHIKCNPNIYIPYVSYVPVEWDFSDLEEKCVYYLEHDEEREKIIEHAEQILTNYYHNDAYLDNFAQLLERANLQ